MTRTDPQGNRQRHMALTFGAKLVIVHYATGARRYFRASGGPVTRLSEWTREEAARYSRRYVNRDSH